MTVFWRIATAASLLALAGCGIAQSTVNALNPFGPSREEALIEDARAGPERPVVDQVLSLEAAPTPGGIIVSSVGLPPTQGFWEADLTRLPSEDPSVLLLDFRVLPPLTPRPVGTQPSREVLAGQFFTTQDLTGVRTIVVQGSRNRRSISRQ